MDAVVDAVQAIFELITREFIAALPAPGSLEASRGWVGLDPEARGRLAAASLVHAQRLARALDELQVTLVQAPGVSEVLPVELAAALAATRAEVARRRATNHRLRELLADLRALEADDERRAQAQAQAQAQARAEAPR